MRVVFVLFVKVEVFCVLITEAEPAIESGIRVCLLRRSDNPDTEDGGRFKCVDTFDGIEFL